VTGLQPYHPALGILNGLQVLDLDFSFRNGLAVFFFGAHGFFVLDLVGGDGIKRTRRLFAAEEGLGSAPHALRRREIVETDDGWIGRLFRRGRF
jgi:hypothetical protein